jgi:hypothetical protein
VGARYGRRAVAPEACELGPEGEERSGRLREAEQGGVVQEGREEHLAMEDSVGAEPTLEPLELPGPGNGAPWHDLWAREGVMT